MTDASETLRRAIRDVPDFPKPGILFRDVTPILANPELHGLALEAQVALARALIAASGVTVAKVVGIESRGFWYGPALAHELQAGFVPLRKPGKLPARTVDRSYGLEYGEDTLHMHADALDSGDGVLVVDDLLATGGTAQAACKLVESVGGRVAGCLFLVELASLEGRSRLDSRRVASVVRYA